MKHTETPHRVLITGAYGLIGNSAFAALLRDPCRFEPHGMVRRVHASDRIAEDQLVRIPDDRLRLADLRDADAVRRATEGIDTVVHLAGDPSGLSGWQSVLESNIAGLYNVFESARAASVRRVIYASTNQVVFGYCDFEPYRTHFAGTPEESLSVPIPPIRHDQPTLPVNLYSCSKIFGESVASLYAREHGMSVLCLRIGWVAQDNVVGYPSLFCSRRDVVQAIIRAIEAPDDLRFDVFFVHSDNTPNFVDIEHTREVLGYQPEDRGQDFPSLRR